uniref:Uncharacterized protein n=1 Tax=Rhizophora mucronata TaxID=61149 RepID=A0A2P2QNW3_RHIMU
MWHYITLNPYIVHLLSVADITCVNIPCTEREIRTFFFALSNLTLTVCYLCSNKYITDTKDCHFKQ